MAVVLIVDDDQRLAQMLQEYLEGQGFGVRVAHGGQQMWAALAEAPVDVIILDWMLPGADGITLARQLRERGGPPILMLSARGEDDERIMGLESGVDDYLAKPFNARELVARLRVLLRRGGKDERGDQLCFGPFCLNFLERRLYRNGEAVDLNPAEMELLLVFARRPRRVLSREFLLQLLGAEEDGRFDRSIDVRVTRLRRVLEENPRQPQYLLTERGAGYRLVPQP
ncbi:response regulator [Acidithiobacillus sp.]